MKELSNWDRWGPDDELGASNLITPAKRKQAAALVKEGLTISLAHDVIQEDAADAGSRLDRVVLNASATARRIDTRTQAPTTARFTVISMRSIVTSCSRARGKTGGRWKDF